MTTTTNHLKPGGTLQSTARDEAGNSITFTYLTMTSTEAAQAREQINAATGELQFKRKCEFLRDRLTEWDVQTGSGQAAPFDDEVFDKLPPVLFAELFAQVQTTSTF